MAKLTVELPNHRYPVLVDRGALQEVPELIGEIGVTGVALVTDRNVYRLWGDAVVQALTGVGVTCPVHIVEPGEQMKSWSELEGVLAFLESSGIDRRGMVIALGGGTVGDLAGFAAAIWLRGVRCMQIPTTLLAMVDSSVGGKTGVNTAHAKNSVGAFWQPAAVIADLAVLDTLPEDEMTSAFGECIKYGISMDEDLALRLASQQDQLRALDPAALEPMVTRCIELKAEVVAADEREAGARAILNYGHTVGHAIESTSGYRAAHGRAVAQGMRVAARLGARMGLCEESLVTTQDRILASYDLPGALPEVSTADVLAALPRDKKATGGRIGWVLPRRLGRAQVGVDVPAEMVADVIEEVWAR